MQLRRNHFIACRSATASARLYVSRQTIKFSTNIEAHFTANWFLVSRFFIFKLLQDMSEYENLNYTHKTRKCTLSIPLIHFFRDFEKWKLKILYEYWHCGRRRLWIRKWESPRKSTANISQVLKLSQFILKFSQHCFWRRRAAVYIEWASKSFPCVKNVDKNLKFLLSHVSTCKL